jgi:hypothetical protein
MALFAGKRRSQERPDQFPGQLRANHARAQDQNVHVIVLYPLVG